MLSVTQTAAVAVVEGGFEVEGGREVVGQAEGRAGLESEFATVAILSEVGPVTIFDRSLGSEGDVWGNGPFQAAEGFEGLMRFAEPGGIVFGPAGAEGEQGIGGSVPDKGLTGGKGGGGGGALAGRLGGRCNGGGEGE